MTKPYTNKTLLAKVQAKAKKIGVSVEPSKTKNKKLDVFKDGKKVASIGDSRYKDFLLYSMEDKKKAKERRKLYKIRHEKHRKKKGTKSYYADKILW